MLNYSIILQTQKLFDKNPFCWFMKIIPRDDTKNSIMLRIYIVWYNKSRSEDTES